MTDMSKEQRVKFYQKGTFTVGNRLVDAESRSVQASEDRSNAITSGHRACQGCGEALGAWSDPLGMRPTRDRFFVVFVHRSLHQEFTRPQYSADRRSLGC